MFSDDPSNPQQSGSRAQPGLPFQPDTPQRLSPAVFQPPRNSNDVLRPSEEPKMTDESNQRCETKLRAEDVAAHQASAESAEAQRIERAEHQNVVESVQTSKHELNVLLTNILPELFRECFRTWTKTSFLTS